jgi:hypothetical protein
MGYGALFDLIGSNPPENLICATTNYDRSLEFAFDRVGMIARTGFTPHPFLSSQLEPPGLGQFQENAPSVIYLHGAVGWYVTSEGFITAGAADRGFNSTLGRPAVLYPDPTKEIERTETAELWQEFTAALATATHLLVIGHSLNDPHLLKALNRVADKVQLGYVLYTPKDHEASSKASASVNKLLPGATIIPGAFGPEPWFDGDAFARWQGT